MTSHVSGIRIISNTILESFLKSRAKYNHSLTVDETGLTTTVINHN